MLGGPSNDDGVLSSTVRTDSGLDVRVSVDQDGARHLLVAVRSSDRIVPEDVVGALLVKRKAYTFDDATALYLDIMCTRGSLFDVFDDLLTDILAELETGGGADTAIEVIQRWRSLLATRGLQTLSQSAQRGLFAELCALRVTQPEGPVDFSVWRGPLQEPHDILTEAFAVEVKSTHENANSVEIHGPLQLAAPGRPLALVLVEITQDSSGETLADLAGELLDRAADRDFATRRLAMAGFALVNADAYPARFTVRRVRHLVVDEHTPRIVPGSFANGVLPDGLLYLRYGIDLSALEPSLIEGVAQLQQWLGSLEGAR